MIKRKIKLYRASLIDANKIPIGVIIGLENITDELRVRNTFKRYVSESIVEQIIDDKLELGMEEVDRYYSIICRYTWFTAL